MASRHDERVIQGLLYLWIRDGRLPLTEETAKYIKSHYWSFLGDNELRFSSEEIVSFIEENHFVQHIVQKLRELRPSCRRRHERDHAYRRLRPKVLSVSLDSD